MPRRGVARAPILTVLILAGLLPLASAALSAQATWYGKTSKTPFVPVRDAAGRFTIDVPARDWLTVSSDGVSALATFVQKNGEAWVVVERTTLNTPLASEDITDLFADLEKDHLLAQQPKATGVATKLFDADGRRFVGLQYTRPGRPATETVRQFSFPAGRELFRVMCGAPSARFDRFEAICAHMAASFRTDSAAR